MHDSPEQQLFSRSRRDFSHGCIRLERPAQAFAVWVLRNNPGWAAEKVRTAMASGTNNQQVNLTRPVPVLIVYATVIVAADGTVHFYDDIYRSAPSKKSWMRDIHIPDRPQLRPPLTCICSGALQCAIHVRATNDGGSN